MNEAVNIPMAALAPFVLLLASIALLPLWKPHFWDNNTNKLKIVVALGIPAAWFLLSAGLGHALYESLLFDYVPFMILLGALFIITGGIFTEIRTRPTPLANTAILGVGTILASFLGTTGAAMLLVRTLLHVNRSRQHKTHTVLFFIATVCNCGGLLTPLGDPPLFMMYLRGAPFQWFLTLLPEWAVTNILLLAVYFIIDSRLWKREAPEAHDCRKGESLAVTMQGKLNFIWLLGVVLAIALINENVIPALAGNHYMLFIREAVIAAFALCSLKFTTHLARVSNSFTWHPIVEVAYLFLGIFVTMVPCLLYLASHAHNLGIETVRGFYYSTGILSSVLDNTPTAVALFSLAQGLGLEATNMVAGIPEGIMRAICTAAVFFGAMTYIGNGPNFMVKTMAEHQGVKLPSFLGYVWKFGLCVLLPIFILVQLLFIR